MDHQPLGRFLTWAVGVLALLAGGCGSAGSDEEVESLRLRTLEITGLALEPAFDPDVHAYRASPSLFASAVELRIRAEAAGARVAVNGKPLPPDDPAMEVDLAPEATEVVVTVTGPYERAPVEYEIRLDRTPGIEQSYLKASYPDYRDWYGYIVGASSERVVVGAWWEDGDGGAEDDDSLESAGAAYVYAREGGGWIQEAYLKPTVPEDHASFGSAVTVQGDTIVVGALGKDHFPAPNAGRLAAAGAAYVFVRRDGAWSQQAQLVASHPGEDDLLGWSVAISGDTLVAGAPHEASDGSSQADDSMLHAGAVYIFVRDGTRWTQQAWLKAPEPFHGERFGHGVALSGDVLVVGAPGESSDGDGSYTAESYESGAAHVFVRSGGTWSHRAFLKAGEPGREDWFGRNVAVSGETVVIGAHREDGDGSSEADDSLTGSGAVYVFEPVGDGWEQATYLKAWNADFGDRFGASVGVWEDTIVVGAESEESDGSSWADDSASGAGAAYLFYRRDAGWAPGPYLKAANADAEDAFGAAVAIAEGVVVVGSYREMSDGSGPDDDSLLEAGAAYVFR